MKTALLLLVTTFLSTVAISQDFPVLVKDIVPDTVNGFSYGFGNRYGNRFVHTEEAFYFYIRDAESIGFWRSNGTHDGTYPLVSFPRSQAYESAIFWRNYNNICAAAVDDIVYFVGVDDIHGIELWETDGTLSGTRLSKDLIPGEVGSNPNDLFNLGGKLLFTASALDELGNKDLHLWRNDGTSATTVPFKKMPYMDKRYVWEDVFTAFNGEAYFSYHDNVIGAELWKTDGTEAGTILVKDIAPGVNTSYPTKFCVNDGKIYFSADHPTYGREPWVSDGTAEGTSMLKDIKAGSDPSTPSYFTTSGGNVYFSASSPNSSQNRGLYVTDGSSSGTRFLEVEGPSLYSLMHFKNRLHYTEYNKIKTFGAIPGTINTIVELNGAWPELVLATEDILYFTLYNNGDLKLWRTDGSSEGTYIIDAPNGEATLSKIYDVFEFKGEVFFVAFDTTHGTELWRIIRPSKSLAGTVYLDINEDGNRQDDEPGLANQKLQIEPGNVAIHTDKNGNFYWAGEPGRYTVTILPAQEWKLSTTTSPDSYTLTLPDAPAVSFGLSPTEPTQELAVNLTSSASSRCSFEVVYWLDYTNKGTLTANGQLKLNADARATLLESTPPATIGTDGSLNWEIQNLYPTQQKRMVLRFRMPDFNSMGDTLRFYSEATINGTAIIAKDTLEQIILCSYDPNDKLVKPAGVDFAHFTLKNSWLDYTIRFQNTGNAEALTVVLRDTLDQNMDLSSFELLGSSHLMQLSRKDRALTFRFDNINLPDSTSNEPESHGFVRYRIKAKAGVAENTVVENTAHIFFDFNPAIVTNTTFNTLVSKLPERVVNGMPVWEAKQVELYPNPSSRSNSITIESRQAFSNVIIYNSLGQPVLHQSWTTASTLQTLVVQNMRPGLYLVELVSGTQKVRKRLIIR